MSEITKLPLEGKDRDDFLRAANAQFERVLDRMEPKNVALTRSLWDAEAYIDRHLLAPHMLPISRDYALSLIEAFLVPHVVGLAVEADKLKAEPPPLH